MVQRTLWYQKDSRRFEISQVELQARVEPLVILGEAGMGKSHLLKWLALQPTYSFCTARQLINRKDPRSLLGEATTLVIDALDEVSAGRDGDAVDTVLRQLSELSFPCFVISCRAADWRSSTGIGAIREHYEFAPLELHLEPFSEKQAEEFLAINLGNERAREVADHFCERGLAELLGNPQTLNLIADVAKAGALPVTRGQLFEKAVKVLQVEHRDERAHRELSQAAGLSAAGAAFATMILTGNEAIARKSRVNIVDGEIAMVDLAEIPNGTDVQLMLGTRLFRSDGVDRFTYLHRRVGEYLGARWLASIARTRRSRRRLLAMCHRYGRVPASLRGIHAWLARDPALFNEVIAADPMGIFEYGDAEDISTEQVRSLLKALQDRAEEHPYARGWNPQAVRGLARIELLGELRRLVVDRATPFSLRLLVIEAIRGSQVADKLKSELRTLVVDMHEKYAIRNASGEALIGVMDCEDWFKVLSELNDYGDEQSSRLAIELMTELGFDDFAEDFIACLVVAHCKRDGRTVGALWQAKERLPDGKLSGVLDCLSKLLPNLSSTSEKYDTHELCEFVYHLIVRRLEKQDVGARELWAWIEPLGGSNGYHQDSSQRVVDRICENQLLRTQLFRLVLLERSSDKALWQRQWQLSRALPGLVLTEDDVISLLQSFDAVDIGSEGWRDVVRLVRHDAEEGQAVRSVASNLASGDRELQIWLSELAIPVVTEWKREEEEKRRTRDDEQSRERDKLRASYLGNILEVRAGKFGALINLAKAYLRLFYDVADVPAHERITKWVGEDIWIAAREGFEAFLENNPLKPSAIEIIGSHLENKHWPAGHILVVALAERFRTGAGFEDLADEVLISGFFELHVSPIDKHAGLGDLAAAIADSLRDRGIWSQTVCDLIEPQLAAGRDRVVGLWELMNDRADTELGTQLAVEWLVKFTHLPAPIELELIQQLWGAGKTEELLRFTPRVSELGDVERRLNWTAVGLLLDFDEVVRNLEPSAIDRELLWHLRTFTGGRRGNGYSQKLSPAQLEWFISTFRALWPYVPYPSGGFSGDLNAWDATDYLSRIINLLASDASDDAASALRRLRIAAKDGYTAHLQHVIAENVQTRVDAHYVPPSLEAISAVANDRPPASVVDLQATMLDELAIVQARITSDDVDSWRGFFSDSGEPYGEERCRDHLLTLLRQGSEGIVLEPEAHVAADKEVDITCAAGVARVPIEVKGQWHPALWNAADTQLDRLYAGDWRAGGRGIYLVLWFGENVPPNKKLVGPGRSEAKPKSPEELEAALIGRSTAAKDGRVEIVVMKIARP